MTRSPNPRCVIIGGTTLPGHCAQILGDNGFVVSAVVTDDPETSRSAASAGVAAIEPLSALVSLLGKQDVDYLFSINNLSLIDEQFLGLPRRGAINFHDGPLPAWAGLNTPSWAILEGATTWGVTWHLMTDAPDAGDILLEEPVEISATDTSLTLNMKCFEAGLRSFPRLVASLAGGSLSAREQDPAKRRYYGRDRRPPAGCVLQWSRPAHELDRLVRALDFGNYPNRLGSPKVLADDDALIVSGLVILDRRSGAAPGTVLEVTANTITVATLTNDVLLRGLRTPEGRTVSADELSRSYGLRRGYRLPDPSGEELARLTALGKNVAPHEDFWTARLAALTPPQLPDVSALNGHGSLQSRSGDRFGRTRHRLSTDAKSALAAIAPDRPLGDVVSSALVILLARLSGQDAVTVAYADRIIDEAASTGASLLTPTVPLHCELDPLESFRAAHAGVLAELDEIRRRGPHLRDLFVRRPELRARADPISVAICQSQLDVTRDTGAALTLVVVDDEPEIEYVYDRQSLHDDLVTTMLRHFDALIAAAAVDPNGPLAALSVLTPDELHRVLVEWNDTSREYPRDACLHELIVQQARRTPDRIAVICRGDEISYAQLAERASALAGQLRAQGVGPGERVGVCLQRSTELIVCLLAVLEAGGAYVPLDPGYPTERIRFMISDAEPVVILCQRATAARMPEDVTALMVIDGDEETPRRNDESSHERGPTADDPAYVIYTSGSTGRPKGVMVSHRNAVNFIYGMDAYIDHDDAGTFLAVTSISFDISVLELFWTLARGFRVVVYTGNDQAQAISASTPSRPIDFSFFFFASRDREDALERYRLLTEAVRFADSHGFSAVWTPERHFHAFGGLFPNPSVTSAAIASMTEHVKIRAGSVVSPLHNPVRIAEEWSFVDNISGGRVGISFASGWQPGDFVLAPENFADRKQLMFRQIELVQRLWRGETVALPGPLGKDVNIQILPRPIQPELPVWVTAAGTPETFRMAGERGFGLLTHLLGQSVAELGEKVRIYRDAFGSGAGVGDGHVALMLHTFVGPDNDQIRELVRAPMKAYLRSSVDLIQKAAWTFPTFKQVTTTEEGKFSLDHLSDQELDEVLDFSFERYFETSGLLGTPEKCLALVDQLRDVGVDEIACLIDFHTDTDAVLAHLPHLDGVRKCASEISGSAEDESIPTLIERYGVTHMQCTPSLASMLVQSDDGRQALRALHQLLVGGEAFPPALAAALTELVPGEVLNMYGPTETTIWSSAYRVDSAERTIPIGRPIANTRFYVLDSSRQLVAPGTAGELFIGGDGVTLGYLNRPELTGERFLPDPFAGASDARMYGTGDIVRQRKDGNVEFVGRNDHQVKVRGYRVELGEIEAALGRHPDVGEAIVVASHNGADADARLVGYLTGRDGTVPSLESLRYHLKQKLPEYMVPSSFNVVAAMPRTPNGKVDRKALAASVSSPAVRTNGRVRPRDELERLLVEVWEEELGVSPVGVEENFFELGGHSLLAVRVFAKLKRRLDLELPLATFLRAPTVEQLAGAIRQARAGTDSHWKALVPIEPSGNKPPLFCVHAHGGHVLFYNDLARRLKPHRPVYALQARGVDGVLEPLTEFSEMAANYLHEVREVQPSGPYRLAGDCLGGVIALEMAHQLRAQGEEVALVAMFDSFHPRYRPYLPPPLYELVHRTRLLFGFNLRNVVRLSGPERIAYVRSKLGRAAYMVRYRLWDWQRQFVGGDSRSDDPLIRTQAALDTAFDAYEPKPYDGLVLLFRSARQPAGIHKDPTLGWGGLLSDLDIRVMRSYFTTGIYEPLVGALANELREVLDQVDVDERHRADGGTAVPGAPTAEPAATNAPRLVRT